MNIGEQYFYNFYNLVNQEDYKSHDGGFVSPRVYFVSDMNTSDLKSVIIKDGFAIVDASEFGNYESVLGWLKEMLGGPIPDSGYQKSETSVIEYQKGSKYFANSHLSQTIHSDDAHTENPPDMITLYCEKQSEEGGVSTISLFTDLYKNVFVPNLCEIENLLKDDCLTLHGTKGKFRRPLLYRRGQYHFGCFLPSILYSMECSELVFEIFDKVMKFVHNPKNQIRLKLRPGQLLLLDNSRAYHGRTAFPQESERKVIRSCFKLDY
jgi:hypothetical protein